MQNNDKIFKVTAENGVPFTVRRVDFGDKYGNENCLTHNEQEPLIEFYDARYPHTEYGQFVSRYYQTSLTSKEGNGVNLDGGIEDWKIDGKSLNEALAAVSLVGYGNMTKVVTEGRMFNALFFDNDQKTNTFLESFYGSDFGVIHSDETGTFVTRNNYKGVAVSQPQPLSHTFDKTEDGRLLHVIKTTNTAEARAAMAGPQIIEVLKAAYARGYFDHHPDDSQMEKDEKDEARRLIDDFFDKKEKKADFTAQHTAMKAKKPTGGMKP